MSSYTYLLVNIFCILIPLIASFYPKHSFFKEWRYFLPANIFVAILFLVWDYYFTRMGIWGFNPNYLTKIYLLNLPLEEVLFFICIPYACVFTYFSLKYLVKNNPLRKFHRFIHFFLMLSMLSIGTVYITQWYTASTFLLAGSYLLYHWFKKSDLSDILLSYVVILPFFFISNGILTGSGLSEPIVWYDDQQNLGYRLLTIPVEDAFYGFLLVMMNIHLYEFFKKKHSV